MTKLRALSTLGFVILVAGCASASGPSASSPSAASPKPMTEAPKLTAGYLAKADRLDSLSLVPPPPAAGSAAQARDDAAAKAAVALQGSDRWRTSISDSELKLPQAAQTFSCALGVKLTPQQAPKLISLLGRTISDLGLSTYGAKTKYMRARPFTVNGAPSCTPGFEAVLRRDGSYPSGHSAVGWGWALMLAEIAPDRADAVLARGRAFGQSRVICNVHWLSDTEEGRVMASAVVAKLHSDPQFRADLDAARAELAALRQAGSAPDRDCAAEAASLANG